MRALIRLRPRLLRVTSRDDQGMTLVAVIGIAAVLAVVSVVLVGSVVFAIGQTTASRSSVSAKSAAEAGIETAAAQVAGGVCWVGGAGTGTSPTWRAQVQRLVSSTSDPALESSWTNGCPTAAPAGSTPTPFRVIATGRSGSPGAGNSSGDVRTIVAQFTVVQRAGSPEFNQAIFGEVQTSAATNLVISGTDADILTDHFNCSTAMNSSGGVYVNSSLSETSTLNTTCEIGGDLVTKGNLNCPANGIVHGDVIVAGNVTWNSTCKVYGNMIVGGSLTCPTSGATILGDLTVVGNATFSSTCVVGGNIHVGGILSISNTVTYPADIWVKGNLNGNAGLTLTSTSGSVRVGGSLTGGLTTAKIVAGTKTIPDPSLPAPVAPNMDTYFPPGDPKLDFPKISATDARWSGWTMRRWRTDLEPLRTATWINVCSITGTGAFSSHLIVNTPTIYDLTQAVASGGCGTGSVVGLGGSLTIELRADMVMFVPGAEFRTAFRVESADGVKHSLYVIESWPTAKASCTTSGGTVRGINLNAYGGTSLSQGPNTQIMIYTPGTVSASGAATLTGQLYGCNVNLSNPVTLKYEAATSSGGSAGRAFIVTERFRMDNQDEELS